MKQFKDQNVTLESLTDESETKAEVLVKSSTIVVPPYKHERKRRWSRKMSHTCNEDNFFHDQFR